MKKLLYIIECLDGDDSYRAVKVGLSNAPKSRVEELQTGNPHELELVTTFKTDAPKLSEARMHAVMREKEKEAGNALGGGSEWFAVNYFDVYELENEISELSEYKPLLTLKKQIREGKALA